MIAQEPEPRMYLHKRQSPDQADEIELVHGDERHKFKIPPGGFVSGCEVGTPNRLLKIIQSREIVIVLKGRRVYRASAKALMWLSRQSQQNPKYIYPTVKDITVWG